jgi:hypothetical protein
MEGRYIVVLKGTASVRADGVMARTRILNDKHKGRLGHVYQRARQLQHLHNLVPRRGPATPIGKLERIHDEETAMPQGSTLMGAALADVATAWRRLK